MDYRKELKNYYDQMRDFLSRFIGKGPIFLSTEDQAKYEGNVYEIKDLFDELWGKENDYSKNLLATVNNGYGGFFGGPSYDSVGKVAALIMAAYKKHSREIENNINLPFNENSKVYVDFSRIEDLKNIRNSRYDLKKLIELCVELNKANSSNSFLAIGMILRTIINYVPPIFGYKNFSEIANNYNGGKSFKELMKRLDESMRKIADNHLHRQISDFEVLPNFIQVNFSAELDLLLAEIISILNKEA